MKLKERLAPYIEYFAESTTACLVTMVQGNVLALGLSHLLIASQTGFAAGIVTYFAVLLSNTGNRLIIAAILGVATGVVDFFVHPGMFGAAATEAIVTGLGAAVLSFIIGTAIEWLGKRRAAAS